jgi:branched-chain amino acid transport system ATP-binding protein
VSAAGDLQVESLRAWYGQAQVLRGITMDVPAGTVVAIFGHNGAGKSTLLRSIARVHTQCSGEVVLGDHRLEQMPAHEVARAGLALVREGARVFDSMTVDEHLELGIRLATDTGRTARTEDEIFGLFPALREKRSNRAGYLSGGQRQMLALGAAFASNPRCLLLDEPSAGLAPVVAAEIFGKVAELAAHGVAVLVAEQNPQWLDTVAQHGYVLETGEVVRSGPLEDLLAHTFTGSADTAGGRG